MKHLLALVFLLAGIATAQPATMASRPCRMDGADCGPLPAQTGNSGKYLTTDGSLASWATVAGGGLSGGTAGRFGLWTGASTMSSHVGLLADAATGRVSFTGATVATDGTGPAFGVTATLPASPSADVQGFNLSITGAGSASKIQSAAVITLGAGFTGNYPSIGTWINNNTSAGGYYAVGLYSAATGASPIEYGVWGLATPTGGGSSIGVLGESAGGTTGIGVMGRTLGSGAGPHIGGYFAYGSLGVDPAPGVSAALVADNNPYSTYPVAIFRASGVTAVTIRPDGGLQLATGTRPTCDASARGTVWYVAGDTGVADTFEVCAKSSTDTYAWVALGTIP